MPDADQLKAYLADRDVPCPGCGYNLRGVAGTACPECGGEIDLERVLASAEGKVIQTNPALLYSLNLLTLGAFVFMCAIAVLFWISGTGGAGDDHMAYINTVLAPGLVAVGIPAAILLYVLATRSRDWLADYPELGLLLNPVSLAVLCWIAFGFAEDLGRYLSGMW